MGANQALKKPVTYKGIVTRSVGVKTKGLRAEWGEMGQRESGRMEG